ncbi:myogenesis-regulating glycosidase isoform X1 [Octopus bimaculoides]|uniref:Glycoside hydrolase family 31 N-terminal domain-containing protein n=1 Tax=Octopus bimaculoides TaxID=37653 RepID=A0A0L8HDQ2_OCTBM|nr:myogenesis-regulating glycosidase isoform X1 [Octopus bimaculoides]XP_014773150.1 myogenesis-regulating glycosidase isoform X1 [Octopus bimaculoides]XP_014773151.1 myogenesis-regulating glycosidase isoform X1 [Octopus bimaculoides]XP_014773152.1 myogenesis-regulating glycosidase isoform X1 [Octopus bimaculoides]XP_014773154.1 myogenesis-regulating glycosidase isoform X1 [Octopus bimaculoides]XP_014773155.1 myogenesis-regulating glycosidase isoform X1 [Octopus bimaculoides]XP_014773156.1 my|eukprot:XP_014773149.1 PREDICTED: uncharacterized family 31 glucosidase KIAA1161-like isoform X1 [Octopus bimaculoides]
MMMATLKVPPLAVPSAYMKRGPHLSSLESCSGSVDLANSNKNLIDVKQTTETLKQANGIGSCLDNIAFEIEDEISKIETKNGFAPSIKSTPDNSYSDAIASTSKDEICFTITGSNNNESISSSGDTQRKEPDISANDSTITSRRSKNVQILDFSNKKEPPKQSYLKRFQLHFMVAITFLFIIGNLSAVWHFHEEERLAIKMGQRISFDTSSRVLTFKDAPWRSQQFKGYLANNIPKGWLPLDCSADKKNVSKMCMRWKGIARVNLEYHRVGSLSCFNVKWDADNKNEVLRDCYTSSLDWFGSSNTGDFQWPLQNVSYSHSPNFTFNDVNTFGHLSEHFWLSSNGIAILLNESTPFHVSWKKTNVMEMCINSNSNSISATENRMLGSSDKIIDKPNPILRYRICYGRNIMDTYSVVRKYFSRNSTKKWPNVKMFEHPHWIAKDAGNELASMSTVIGLAKELAKRNLSCSTMEVFGKWESEYGNLEFNEIHFGNISNLTDQSCDLMLPIRPYVHHNSQRFSEGIEKNYFIMDAGGRVPGLVNWSNGVGAMLDASHTPAVDWFMQKLKQLQLLNRISSFHFTYDGNMSLPFQPHFKRGFHSGDLNQRFSEIMGAFSDEVIVDHVSHSQNSSVFVTVQSLIVSNDTSICFTNLIEKSFVLSILGYPYIMSDGISFGDGTISNKIPNEIVYQRWLQASIFFPAIRFSVTPWSYSESVVENIKKLLAFRQKTVIPYLMGLKNDTLAGVPFIRPIWWSYPNDSNSLAIKDQYLVGDSILVAPLFCDQPSHRNIYIPAGIWEDVNKKKVVDGPMWLVNYSISITEVPYFYRMPQHKRVG